MIEVGNIKVGGDLVIGVRLEKGRVKRSKSRYAAVSNIEMRHDQ